MFDATPWKGTSESTRRSFLEGLAKAAFGITVAPTVLSGSAYGASPGAPKAKQIIYLFMNGAMSHLDTFDPKPGTKAQGQTKAIGTKVAGIQIGEHLPKTAQVMDRLALIRSMTTETGAHQQGQYLMRTSYKQLASMRHPALSAWFSKIAGKGNQELPSSVLIGNSTGHPGAGFFDADLAPVPIASARLGLQNTKSPGYLKDSAFKKRMSLANSFDRTFQQRYDNAQIDGYNRLYREAVKLLGSDSLIAFDINQEPKEALEKYGEHNYGQSMLLARRLIEHQIGFVEVSIDGWDDHLSIYSNFPSRCKQLDQAFSQLILDLESRGKLDSTLVVLATEFGRTPKINQNAGRDHHPGAYTCVLAGGGIAGGQVYGGTDDEGYEPEDDHVTVQDFNATIAHGLGIDLDYEVTSPAGRPFTVVNNGRPIKKLFR